jgi:L-methionine (R)-S-oxide reductase
MPRDYTGLIESARGARPEGRDAAMRLAVDLLWRAFGNKPISWVGFYDKIADADEMILVCREPKPACSPIGLHGMCGRSWEKRRSILVSDVRSLGSNYIACDPKDRSELVVPLLDGAGACSGVLDVDSYALAAFNETDVRATTELLIALGLTTGPSPIDKL